MTVAIVEYGMGNLDSVARAVEHCGGTPLVTCDPADLEVASHIILPGVGSFATGMKYLHERGLVAPLAEQVLRKRIPFLGICLGMQLLASRGFEGGETEGLGWISGDVVRLEPGQADLRVPHVGWNEVLPTRSSPLFADLLANRDVYFVHSYHLQCHDAEDILATTPYGGPVVAAVEKANVYGVQFHPEKSQKIGFAILTNFLAV